MLGTHGKVLQVNVVSINFVVVVFFRKEKRVDNAEIQKFISKKADLLFALSWKSDAPATPEVNEDGEGELYFKNHLIAVIVTVLHSDKIEHKTMLCNVVNHFFPPDSYAVMPPLEQFMEIPSMDQRELFFRDIERGDIVIGRISSIREFGFFMVLICLGSGIMRDISHLEITVSFSFFSHFIASVFESLQ